MPTRTVKAPTDFCDFPLETPHFSLQERSNFLAALKSKGFHVISTPERLMEDLPGRSRAEIIALINMYKRKRVRCLDIEQTSGAASDNISSQHPSQHQQQDVPPIELWFGIIRSHMDGRAKRDDLSDCLAEVVRSIGKKEEEDELSHIYSYITDCLEWKYPRELTLNESAILINLLEQLKSSVDEGGCIPERSFLKGGSWWDKNHNEHDESGGEIQNHNNSISPLMQTTITSEAVEGTKSSSSPSRNERVNSKSGSSDDPVEQFLTSCLEFSKIKRISKCLNPLQVPVKMLNQRQEQMFHQENDQANNK